MRGRLYTGWSVFVSKERIRACGSFPFRQQRSHRGIALNPCTADSCCGPLMETTAGGELLWGVGGWSEAQPRCWNRCSIQKAFPGIAFIAWAPRSFVTCAPRLLSFNCVYFAEEIDGGLCRKSQTERDVDHKFPVGNKKKRAARFAARRVKKGVTGYLRSSCPRTRKTASEPCSDQVGRHW